MILSDVGSDAPLRKYPHLTDQQLSPLAVVNILQFAPSKKLRTRICPEWNYLATNYATVDENSKCGLLPESFLGTSGFRIMLGKVPGHEALRTFFTRGDPIVMHGTIPEGLIADIVQVS